MAVAILRLTTGVVYVRSVSGTLTFASGGAIQFANGTTLIEDAANTLAQRNGTNPQAFNLYNTFTDASNEEHFRILWSSNLLRLETMQNGTGISRSLLIGTRGAPSSIIFATNGATRWTIDADANFIGSVATGGLGYGVGQGGTVTQATSKSTGVTLNTVTGEITMNAASLAANTLVSFTLTNSAIAAGDYILIQHVSAGTQAAYHTTALAAAGSATINVKNDTAGALAEAIVLKYMVFKSATA